MMRVLVKGRIQGLVAITLATATVVFIVGTTTRFPTSAAQLAGAGLAVMAFSVVLGWSAGIGLASLPLLSGAVIEHATVSTQDWFRATVIGCLWYCTAELAWDSIERRDGHQRTRAVNIRRLQEVASVVGATVVLALVSLILIGQAPDRTLWIQVLTLGMAVAALIAAGRHLTATGSDATSGE